MLEAIIDGAARLCDAPGGIINQVREADGRLAPRVSSGVIQERLRTLYRDPFTEALGLPATPDSGSGQALVEARTIHTRDVAEAEALNVVGLRDVEENVPRTS